MPRLRERWSAVVLRVVRLVPKTNFRITLRVAELAKANVVYRALTHLTFGAVLLLGKTECGVATPAEADRLRLMTPAVKAFASDRASYVMEECMALMGGQGYMEETGFGT